MRECYPILKLNYNKEIYYDNSWFQNFYFEDYYGNLISKNKYKFAKSFNDGYAFVYGYDKNWDIINSIGNSVLKDFSTPTIRAVEMAFKCVSPKDGFFLKNYVIKRNLIISVNIKRLIHQSELFDIKGIPKDINRHGYLLININNPKKMSLVEDYSMSGEGLIAIKHFDKEWIYISIQSFNNHILEKKHFEDTFEFATGFSEGLAKVKKGGLFGFIDINGEFSIPAIYDDARSFSNGYAAVSIANCRNNIGWNKGVKLYDLAWNFIDKNNDVLFSEPKYNLTRIDNKKNYYFEANNNIGYTFFWENLDKNYFQAKSLEGLYGWESKSIGRPHRDFWFNSSIIGEFSPSFLVDLLTAQNSDELGFHGWHVACWIAKDRKKSSQNLGYSFSNSVGSADTYIIVKDKKVIAESFYIDFDSTQSELDYILGNNSLEEKYGLDYTEMNWKTKITPPSNSYNSNYDVDWSNYNDSLDMDQQDIDFWNQF